MRCSICDVKLNEFESTKKYPSWHELGGQYLDMCSVCLKEINETVNLCVDFNAEMIDHDIITDKDENLDS